MGGQAARSSLLFVRTSLESRIDRLGLCCSFWCLGSRSSCWLHHCLIIVNTSACQAFQIIVVDDGSSDNTYAAALSASTPFPKTCSRQSSERLNSSLLD